MTLTPLAARSHGAINPENETDNRVQSGAFPSAESPSRAIVADRSSDRTAATINPDDPDFLERCEATAMRYFRSATKEALQVRTQTVVDLQPYWDTPKYRRLYAAASEKYETAVKPAHALYLKTLAELEATGEVSEQLSEEWDALRIAQAFIALGERLFADQIEHDRDHARELRREEV